jgi:hypothetical protein
VGAGHFPVLDIPEARFCVSQLTYHPMSRPHRLLLYAVCLCVVGLMVAMMARTIEFYDAKPEAVVTETEEDERPRIPLPAGPRRFQ